MEAEVETVNICKYLLNSNGVTPQQKLLVKVTLAQETVPV